MRRSFTVLAAVLFCTAVLSACGSDKPTSFQSLIFGSWNAQGTTFTFKRISFTEGSSPLVGTYAATIVTQGDPNDPSTISEEEESGTIGIAGSTLLITRPGFGQQSVPFSIDGNTLTLTTNLGPELYAK